MSIQRWDLAQAGLLPGKVSAVASSFPGCPMLRGHPDPRQGTPTQGGTHTSAPSPRVLDGGGRPGGSGVKPSVRERESSPGCVRRGGGGGVKQINK